MKKLWLTYAWKDNEDKDIDFIVKKLDESGIIKTHLDRRNLVAGQRLWTQIGSYITDPEQTDALGVVVTPNSLKSNACIEELSYALDRALSSRDNDYPVFALLHKISARDLPPSLKIRLGINLENNPNWVSEVESATEGHANGFIPAKELEPFIFKKHFLEDGTYCFEIRPRSDRISPFALAVEIHEKESGAVSNVTFGPSGRVTTGFAATRWIDSATKLTDGTECWVWGADNEISPTTSVYLFYKQMPNKIWFGHQDNMILLSNPMPHSQ